MEAIVIKGIETSTFEIGLYELPQGGYCIAYDTVKGSSVSEEIMDFNLASFMFDMKVQELEGQ